jgi:hypothetical protein
MLDIADKCVTEHVQVISNDVTQIKTDVTWIKDALRDNKKTD